MQDPGDQRSRASEHPTAELELLQSTVSPASARNQPADKSANLERAERAETRQHGNRSEVFDYDYEPFRDNDDLHLQGDKVSGPIWFMNPTRAIYSYDASSFAFSGGEGEIFERLESKRSNGVGADFDAGAAGVEYKWTSRNDRKGRHALIIREQYESANPYSSPPSTRGPRPILRGLYRMLTVFTIHDVSYLLALAFTLACSILVISALLSFLPYIDPTFQYMSSNRFYRTEALLGAIGSTLFLAGGLISFSEAVNINRKGCFGWKLQHVSQVDLDRIDSDVEKDADVTLLVPDGSCSHRHDSYKVVAGHPESWREQLTNDHHRPSSFRPQSPIAKSKPPWVWLPSLHELRSHLRYDFGFIAATIIMSSSLLYCAMAWAAVGTTFVNGQTASWIRVPQLIAAVGFLTSTTISMIETQQNWYKPSPGVIGWHASLCNIAGSVGFVLTAVFGYLQSSRREMAWSEYQFGCSFLWGSLAFLVGSLLQWYEALDKYPVERVREKEGKK